MLHMFEVSFFFTFLSKVGKFETNFVKEQVTKKMIKDLSTTKDGSILFRICIDVIVGR